MKRLTVLALVFTLTACVLSGCGTKAPEQEPYEGTQIVLADSKITVDGAEISADTAQAVYTANDIVYYEEGHDFTYGEGTDADAHSKEEADAHTVVHITEAGQYVLSGTLSKGQIAVDLGDGAEENPEAVVTLVLNSVDITCEVAPAVIFYSVYECGDTDTETATKDVDTSKAGANVIIADGSENTVNGAYVARIYKPDSVVLNEDGTEVEDAKKLHKYDAAFYSKMSMNVNGGTKGNGTLNINAENEGLDSELHLTVNGGNINIVSGNDGINTNEDYVSVTTINGGSLNILVNGETGEGDGIDSNGWLVINGGSVVAQACSTSGDAGIDSDLGIHLNGGTVIASGNMLDRIGESKINYAVFTFNSRQRSGDYSLKNSDGEAVFTCQTENDFTYLILAGESLSEGDYTLWCGEKQLEGTQSNGGFGGGMMKPDSQMPGDFSKPERFSVPEDFSMPENMTPPEGFEGKPQHGGKRPEDCSIPEGMTPPETPQEMTPPEGFEDMSRPQGERPDSMQHPEDNGEATTVFTIKNGGNYFSVAG